MELVILEVTMADSKVYLLESSPDAEPSFSVLFADPESSPSLDELLQEINWSADIMAKTGKMNFFIMCYLE